VELYEGVEHAYDLIVVKVSIRIPIHRAIIR
jgi:hypothetical protein